MKQVTTPENIILKDFDIEVTPYLTLKEQQMIVKTMLSTDNYLEQQQLMVAGIIYTCTNLLDGEVELDAENPQPNAKQYTYEDLVYSGVWEALLKECPYIKQAIKDIHICVKKLQSMETAMVPVLDSVTTLFDKGTEFMDTVREIIQSKEFGEKVVGAIASAIKQ